MSKNGIGFGYQTSVTQDIHRISADLPAGRHLLTITDQNGNRVSRWFEVVE